MPVLPEFPRAKRHFFFFFFFYLMSGSPFHILITAFLIRVGITHPVHLLESWHYLILQCTSSTVQQNIITLENTFSQINALLTAWFSILEKITLSI